MEVKLVEAYEKGVVEVVVCLRIDLYIAFFSKKEN